MVAIMFNPFITLDHNQNCKRHFNGPSYVHSNIMLKQLQQDNVHSTPIHRDKEVQVVGRHYKDAHKDMPSTYSIEQIQCEKTNGTTVCVGIHPSQVVITRLKLDKKREKVLECKAKSQQVGKEKGKYQRRTY
ncbi:60S ribosomal protein L26 [Plecturocebus cupreus]